MNAFVLLMWITLIGVAALFIALALFIRAIVRELESIGGPATRFFRPVNYLSKIRLGLRAVAPAAAIASNTSAVPALDTTISLATEILAAAGGVAQKLETIANVLEARASRLS
ncbi:MAG: hypothetical protein LC791_13350 [Acidobacteria bacterium]|nr:hypothetical protein [Acidobacteriota bacterium]